jgi:putative transcriptional regulator
MANLVLPQHTHTHTQNKYDPSAKLKELLFNNPHILYLSRLMRYMFPKCLILSSNNIWAMNRIKEVLDRKGIKQTWLAERLGKSYNMVNSYVQNRQQPRLEILNEIARILDVDVVDLIVSSKKK